jgi:hypothetical protein
MLLVIVGVDWLGRIAEVLPSLLFERIPVSDSKYCFGSRGRIVNIETLEKAQENLYLAEEIIERLIYVTENCPDCDLGTRQKAIEFLDSLPI